MPSTESGDSKKQADIDSERKIQYPPTKRNKPNYICNIRAPDQEHFQIWLDFKKAAKTLGIDLCYLSLSLYKAFLKSIENPESSQQIRTGSAIINITQQNYFQYNVQKPRRIPTDLICSKTKYNSTLRSLFVQAYIMEKARDIQRSFSFMDFQELGHDLFRKSILELKNRKKIIALKPRANPQVYILTEWDSRYHS